MRFTVAVAAPPVRLVASAVKVSAASDIETIKNKIEELNLRILFSDIVENDSFLYEVEKGDTLDEIAKKFNTTVELLKKANGLTSDMIKVGDTLKVVQSQFSVVVDKSQNILILKKGCGLEVLSGGDSGTG